MKNSSELMSKVNLSNKQLQKLNFEQINKLPKTNIIDVQGKTSHEIVSITDKIIKIKTNTVVNIVPEALFTANISYLIEYNIKSKVSQEEVEANINELIGTIGSDLSFILSVLTEKALNSHLILPPDVFFESVNSQTED